jgi:hypothetical protein
LSFFRMVLQMKFHGMECRSLERWARKSSAFVIKFNKG